MISTYFGNPGCGKTTLAVKMAKKNQKYYDHVFLNFDHKIKDGYIADLNGIGEWTFPDHSFICIDEAGIEYNSRAYKSLPKSAISWFKKHRHYKCDVAVFSQSWDDMDVTIRRLSVQLWYMYRIGPFTLCRRLYKRVMVDKTTHQIIDGYRMCSMVWLLLFPFYWLLRLFRIIDKKFMLTFRPFYYKYFDSYSKDNIPVNYHKRVEN